MEVLLVVLPLMLVLIFLLPRKADPGKKISPAGLFAILLVAILAIIWISNR